MGNTADASAAAELIARFPSLGEKSKEWVLRSIEVGLRDGKLEFLRRINDFEEQQKKSGPQITFTEWVKQTRAMYEELTATP